MTVALGIAGVLITGLVVVAMILATPKGSERASRATESPDGPAPRRPT